MIKKYLKKLIKEVLRELETDQTHLTHRPIKFNIKDIFWKQFFNEKLENIRLDIEYYDENFYHHSKSLKFSSINEFYNFISNPIPLNNIFYLREAKLWISFRYKGEKRLELWAPFITNTKPISLNYLQEF